MDNPTTWIGVFLFVVGIARVEWNAYQTRVTAREKVEADRLAARDKMEFDESTRAIQLQNKQQAGQIAANAAEISALKGDHAVCRESHAAVEQKLSDCEKKHDTMEVRVNAIELALRK